MEQKLNYNSLKFIFYLVAEGNPPWRARHSISKLKILKGGIPDQVGSVGSIA